MTDLVPIKVKIPLKGGSGKDANHHKYPDFNALPAEVREDMNWAHFFDVHGISWHYDKLSGHGEVDQSVVVGDIHKNNDPALWYGGTCVPGAFADAAVAMFPDEVEILSEADWERFYDDRSHILEDEDLHDLDALQKLQAIEDIERKAVPPITPSAATKSRRANILNPEHPSFGIRKNHKKTWALFKARRAVNIRAAERKPQ
ncbi:hypothetical protein KAU11_06625 [Candidatus Babeliales bacterium]|nr:hypothetical protein [Candidatus Babeliales bacterium]